MSTIVRADIERLVTEAEAYRPQRVAGSPWPPASSIRAWGRDEAESMSMSRDDAVELLSVIHRLDMPRRRAVISSFGNGLSTLFWSRFFDRVLAVTPQALPDGRLRDDKVDLVTGSLDRTKFVYDLLTGLDEVNLLLLDEPGYARAISPFYLFRKKLTRPALVVLVGMRQPGMQRFVADLESGHLDGFRHEIVRLPGEAGAGVAYEQVVR